MTRIITALLRGGLVAAILCALPAAGAHGDVDAAVGDLTRRLAADPDNAALLLRRAGWHAIHGDYEDSARDLERVAALNPDLPGLDLAWARLRLEQRRPDEARRHLDRALGCTPDDAEILVLRARVAGQLGDPTAAMTYYDRVLAVLKTPTPALYLERAEIQPDPRAALRGLNEGLARLGPVVSLHVRALELEERLGDLGAALVRVDTLSALGARPETWLAHRGDLLRRAGRGNEAQEAYRSALAAVDRLPAALRDGPDMQLLRTRLDARLAAAFSHSQPIPFRP